VEDEDEEEEDAVSEDEEEEDDDEEEAKKQQQPNQEPQQEPQQREISAEELEAALKAMSECSQGYDWNERDEMSNPCQFEDCGSTGDKGWQCGGQGHWICRQCVLNKSGNV
jgi:hypothetical protein